MADKLNLDEFSEEDMHYFYKIMEGFVDEYAETLDTHPYNDSVSDQVSWNSLSSGFLEHIMNRMKELQVKDDEEREVD